MLVNREEAIDRKDTRDEDGRCNDGKADPTPKSRTPMIGGLHSVRLAPVPSNRAAQRDADPGFEERPVASFATSGPSASGTDNALSNTRLNKSGALVLGRR
jgi:hypothetical protein